MISLALFIITVAEFGWMMSIVRRWSDDGTFERFIAQAPIDQYLRAGFHAHTGMLTLQMLTLWQLR
jgi:hypothetical protein